MRSIAGNAHNGARAGRDHFLLREKKKKKTRLRGASTPIMEMPGSSSRRGFGRVNMDDVGVWDSGAPARL